MRYSEMMEGNYALFVGFMGFVVSAGLAFILG
jgi:hypothetical protein